MYSVKMYKDARGTCQVCELINTLDSSNSKQDKVALKKLFYQLERLENKGTRVGEPITKHLTGDIWELRPGKYRITYVVDGTDIILLTWFPKKSQKTPAKEIARAEQIYKDWQNNRGQ